MIVQDIDCEVNSNLPPTSDDLICLFDRTLRLNNVIYLHYYLRTTQETRYMWLKEVQHVYRVTCGVE